MAKAKRKHKTPEEPPINKWELFWYLGKILLVSAVCLYLWIACITFDATDWPNPDCYRHPSLQVTHNWCGITGAYVSFALFHYFGEGAWVLLLLVTCVGFMVIVAMSETEMALRVAGMLVLVAVGSGIFSLLEPPWASDLPLGAGGVLGFAITHYLEQYFSLFGAALILLVGLAVGLILAADEFVVYLPVLFRQVRARADWLVEQFRQRYLVPQTAPSRPRKALPAPPRTAVAVADPDDDDDEVEQATRFVDDDEADQPDQAEEEEDEESEDDQDEGDEDVIEAEAEPAPAVREEPKIFLAKPLPEKKNSKPTSWPKDMGDWELPPLELLNNERQVLADDHESQVREKAKILERTLSEFRIDAAVVEIDTGPVVTLFELQLGPGIKVKSIDERSKDLARALKSPSVRVVAPIPGKNTIGIEVPNLEKQPVRLRELIELSGSAPGRMTIPLFLGKDASGNPLVHDLCSMPHLLIAGTTGSGKSVCINSIIMSVLLTQRPDHVKMILVDPKMVELSSFKEIPHLMCPVVHDVDRAQAILEWLVQKMEERYAILSEAQVRNISAYNNLGRDTLLERFQPTDDDEASRIQTYLPYMVLVIDELADLMMVSPKEVELSLARLAQKSRAVGIHIILATQRPEAKVVTGLIKSNLPTRVAFRVNSRLDSRIVMDQNGAEDLLGMGDMLFLPPGSGKPVRAQGTLVDDHELKQTLKYLRDRAEPEFHDELMQIGKVSLDGLEKDEFFDEAVRLVLESKRGSVSLLQRKLNVGYSRASRLIEQMAAAGIVGDYKGSQAREVSMTIDEYEALKAQMQTEVDDGMTD
ncbi:MAG: DNA translocase FtsK [Phycisphaerae bacterium]|nr:DNA translocase FtsK [Phycisphaerae bacterium]